MSKEYNEVIEILNHVDKDDLNKIPREMYDMFKANIDGDYTFKYDVKKTLQEQNVSKECRTIIAILYRDYWATEEERQKIKEKENHDIQLLDEKIGKCGINDIFKVKENKNETEENTTKVIDDGSMLIKLRQNFIFKFINLVKHMLKK